MRKTDCPPEYRKNFKKEVLEVLSTVGASMLITFIFVVIFVVFS